MYIVHFLTYHYNKYIIVIDSSLLYIIYLFIICYLFKNLIIPMTALTSLKTKRLFRLAAKCIQHFPRNARTDMPLGWLTAIADIDKRKLNLLHKSGYIHVYMFVIY